MPQKEAVRIVQAVTERGYNIDRDAVTLIAGTPDPEATIDRLVDSIGGDELVIDSSLVRSAGVDGNPPRSPPTPSTGTDTHVDSQATESPPETGGLSTARSGSLQVLTDMTGSSTGTGQYEEFVEIFRDRLDRLRPTLEGRVTRRPATAITDMSGGQEVAMIGLVTDIWTTRNGHRRVVLEDRTGTFDWVVMKDRDEARLVDDLLFDEVVAIEGSLSNDGDVGFVNAIHQPDIPRTNEPNTAERPVQAALVSDLHVGSEEFLHDAWTGFAEWLHSPAGSDVEYLCIAGDMVEGVGVYPNQDETLEIVDIYDQYEAFQEHLKDVPGDIEIVMIPGNHDAVRLAEPQPGFDETLREIMGAHDARVVSNPATVDLEGVSLLLYHGVSLDEVIAETPSDAVEYETPEQAMIQLLKKRHLAPPFGGRIRVAPEVNDHLLIDEIPDIFHAGHVHKLGMGKYNGVLAINSGCWQAQTDFQRNVNIDPDAGYAPIVSLDTLEVTVQKFG